MPFNETAVYLPDKHSKHETPSGSSSRESKLASPTVQCMGKPIDNPLIKYLGCKWEQVFDFDKVLKQIRSAERYYLRGRHDQGTGNSKSNNARCSFPRREQPQVQRLSSNDMHFYGMVPKQPFDVVVCDICLGIYTKMGFNNHMKLHHPQAWNIVSSKASNTKELGDTVEENLRELNTTVNLLTEQTTATTTAAAASGSSRHKSSKSSSGSGANSGGSSRSRSKSKHHHHHHQQQQQQRSSSAAAITSSASSHASQTEVSTGSTSTKSSKKTGLSGLSSVESKILSVSVPKDIHPDIQPVPLFSSTSSVSLPPPSSKRISADVSGTQQESVFPSSSPASKEKPKASKRKSKNISVLSLPPPESNESSNSSVDFTTVAAAATASATVTVAAASTSSKSTSKRSKPKGKDLKQLMEPQLSELDKAISSITGGGQTDSISEKTNSNNDSDYNRTVLNSTPSATTSTSSLGYNTEEVSTMPMPVQVPITSTQQLHYGSVQMLPETTTTGNNINQQQQLQPQRSSNGEDNDNSILTLEDMLDSKFIHEILNTDESEIHFDESELDKVAQQQQQQQQQQQEFMHTIANKRMRYDEQIGNVDNVVQQAMIPGKYAAFQQQQQQQTQQSFHVTNLYTTAIDPMQLQQLLYQQQQQQHQQGLNAYGVGNSLDEATAAALEQQQYNDSDVIMCSAEQLHKEGKINAADYATLAALSGNGGNTYSSVVPNNVCDVNAAIAAAAQFQVYNIPSLTDDDDIVQNTTNMVENKLGDVIIPQNHYVLPAENNDDEEQLIYEITANNQVAVISQQRQQQMIAEFLTQAGYDSVDNVNVNLNINSGAVLQDDAAATVAAESKYTNTFENDNNNELLDFDFSRLDIVKSCSSSSSSSADSKGAVKAEHNPKLISPSHMTDDIFLNVFLYSGLPRPMAVNSFGLCKLPQGVATTFRKNLHATRKANNSPISLNANASRFSTNAPNAAKSTTTQNYFTALGGSTTTTTTGNMMNEFSIGSITITNQQTQNSNNAAQQQQHKQTVVVQSPIELVNGLITTVGATSPSTTNNARLSRPKSAGSTSSSGSNQSKQKTSSNFASGNNNNNATTILPLSQNQAKTTIIVNANNANSTNNASHQTKFIKRSLISKTTNSTLRNSTNFTAKQLSEILLNPSKEKYLQLLATKDQDKDGGVSAEQRLNNVRNFYERRKRLLNGTTSNATGYNPVRQLNIQQQATPATVTASTAGLKQKFLRQRLMRTLSDCGINSIKTSSNSANNSGNNDILRVS